MKTSIIILFSILFLSSFNLTAQSKISLNKSNWFFEIADSNNVLPDTIKLFKRTSYDIKIEKGVLNSKWLDNYESEYELFKHLNYGNFSFYKKNKMLCWTIIDGTLNSINSKWQYKLTKSNTFKIISNKQTICVYEISQKKEVKIPVQTNEGIIWVETELLTLIKKKHLTVCIFYRAHRGL
jgi:hypothetical protein